MIPLETAVAGRGISSKTEYMRHANILSTLSRPVSNGMTRRIALLAIAFFVATPVVASAQSSTSVDLPALDDALSITVAPAYPRPGDQVTLTLTSTMHDLDSSAITWRAGGVVLSEGIGEKSARIIAGSLGQSTTVRADIAGGGGVQRSIVPTSVDLLWESDSYTPPLYIGKALPSAGSRVKLAAFAYIPRVGGGFYDAKDLVYTWRLDGGLLKNLSGRGKSSASIAAPTLFGGYTVSVDVSTVDGRVSGRGSVTIRSVEPHLRLYRDHPLRGIEYGNALTATTFVDESEATFVAVPFFAPVTNANALVYTWRVNGSALATDSDEPAKITLSSAAPGTRGVIELSLTHRANILMAAEGSWGMTFLPGSDTRSLVDPFGGTQ